jgi:hypothetical protein
LYGKTRKPIAMIVPYHEGKEGKKLSENWNFGWKSYN